jgi:hypothetical protein
MRHKLFRFLAICTFGAAFAASSLPAIAQSFTTFDPDGSLYTVPISINDAGAITGFYSGDGNLYHSFVRSKKGIITAFDVPGAYLTYAHSINDAGAIAGYSVDDTGNHGFVRSPKGIFTTFDVPCVFGKHA